MALTPTVAEMVVASPAWLLGEKVVVAVASVAPEEVVVEDGVTVEENPAVAGVVTLKVIGTPGWFVLRVAVTVDAALPATKLLGLPATLVMVVPVVTVYTAHVGPGYDAGVEPPSIRVVVNVD